MDGTTAHRPRLSYESEQIMVFDDFLSAEDRKQVFAYCNAVEYNTVHATGWRKVWRMADGLPLRGTTSCFAPTSRVLCHPKTPVYPTGSSIDKFIDRIISVLPDIERLIGRRSDWLDFTVTPWIYPIGAGLSLHTDGPRLYSGSYTYFLHETWNVHWGGQLLVLHSATEDTPDALRDTPLWLVDDSENQRVWEPGFASCIFPKPNRIVFISPSAQHLLTRVNSGAGQNARISLAGFFRRPRGPLVDSI